jgi:hypothetical protein
LVNRRISRVELPGEIIEANLATRGQDSVLLRRCHADAS